MTQNLAGAYADPAELGAEGERTLLRHHQHLAVGIVEVIALHRLRDEVNVRGHSGLGVHVAAGGDGVHAGEEGERLLRDRHRSPAQLPYGAVMLARRRRGLPERQRGPLEPLRMPYRRPDAVKPGALVAAARGGERRAGELLGVKAVGRPLRRVLAHGERARQRLGLEVVAEPRHVARRRRLRPLQGAGITLGLAAVCHGNPPWRRA